MKRRSFLHTGLFALSTLPFKQIGFLKEEFPDWILSWIKIHDRQLSDMAKYKVTDEGSIYRGGYQDDAELPNPQSTAIFIGKACMLWACQESVYFNQSSLIPQIEAALNSLLRMQHEDGTIDLLSTNFHSTPDTAFVLEHIIPAYQFIYEVRNPVTANILYLLKKFILKAAEALTVGGIHTPNHRWVVCASLTEINKIFPNKKYVNRIKQWLAEHIDLDADGQYTEKSTNSYSPIVNRSLIVMAEGLPKPELLEAVMKNLQMTLYYVHPNGEIVTEASNRQDRGTIGNMHKYYFGYRFMALKYKDSTLSAMCRLIETTCTTEQLSGFLGAFLIDRSLWRELPQAGFLPTSYAKEFPHSGVVRLRRNHWDCTLLSNNIGWLTFHKGNAVIQAVRIASSFFGKGQFQTAAITQHDGAWVLKSELEGPYYQPLEESKISPDGDWEKMPRSLRQQSEIQKLLYQISVREHAKGLEIAFDLSGTDGVPVSLEIIFRPGGIFTGVDALPNKKDTYLLSNREGTYTVGTDTITFSPGIMQHKGLHLRGAAAPIEAPTVYLTGLTPFKHLLTLS
jgi:hypothetical protein